MRHCALRSIRQRTEALEFLAEAWYFPPVDGCLTSVTRRRGDGQNVSLGSASACRLYSTGALGGEAQRFDVADHALASNGNLRWLRAPATSFNKRRSPSNSAVFPARLPRPGPAAVLKGGAVLVTDEIQRPAPWPSTRPGSPFAHTEPFFTIERAGSVDARRFASLPQRDEKPPAAKALALVGGIADLRPQSSLGRSPGLVTAVQIDCGRRADVRKASAR